MSSQALLHHCCQVYPISSAAPAVQLMTHFSPHMHTEVSIASITAVCLWQRGDGAAPSPLHVPGATGADPDSFASGSARKQLPCSAAVPAVSVPPSGLVLPLLSNLTFRLTGISAVALPRHKKVPEQGDTIGVLPMGCWLPSTVAVPCYEAPMGVDFCPCG